MRPVVLITRPEHSSKKFSEYLAKLGINSMLFPTIKIIRIDNWNLPQLSQYNGLLFSSSNAIEVFFQTVDAQSIQIPCYTINTKSFFTLKELGVKKIVNTGAKTAQAFADYMRVKDLLSKHYLFIRGSLSKKTLQIEITQAGGICEELCIYKTVYNENPKNLDTVKKKLQEGEISSIAFFSPSAVLSFSRLVSIDKFNLPKIFSIGETTKKAIEIHLKTVPDLTSPYPNSMLFATVISNYYSSST